MSTQRRVLIGCGIGCGALLLLSIALAVGFGVWLNRPGELLETERLVGPETSGYLEWTLDLEDPGTAGFVDRLILLTQRLADSPSGVLPPAIEGWLESRRKSQTEEDIRKAFPLVAAWTLDPGADGSEDLHVLTVSLQRIGNQLVFGDWILGFVLTRAEGVAVERYRGEKIYQLGTDGDAVTAFLRGNDVFFVSGLETARRAVDRLTGGSGASEPTTPLRRLLEETPRRRPLYGGLTNETGEIARLWRQIASPETGLADEVLPELRGLVIDGGLDDDGSLTGTIRLLARDAERAAATHERIVESLREGLEWLEVDLSIDGRAVGETVEIDLRVDDLVGYLERSGETVTVR